MSGCGTWGHRGLGSAGGMLGLSDLGGLFQPSQFHDAISAWAVVPAALISLTLS